MTTRIADCCKALYCAGKSNVSTFIKIGPERKDSSEHFSTDEMNYKMFQTESDIVRLKSTKIPIYTI